MKQDYPKPIAPPPEVTGEWWIEWDALDESERPRLEDFIADRASQYAADQELEACCAQIDEWGWEGWAEKLRITRRPKPPSLKEQAIAVLEDAELDSAHYNILLRALERLDD
jgi:hypothetical protein